MADNIIALTDVKASLGLLPYVPPAALPSGIEVNAVFGSPSGGVSQYAITGITGLQSTSIVSVQAQVVSGVDLTAGVALLSAQPVALGGGSIVVYATTPTNPITFSWVVHKF